MYWFRRPTTYVRAELIPERRTVKVSFHSMFSHSDRDRRRQALFFSMLMLPRKKIILSRGRKSRILLFLSEIDPCSQHIPLSLYTRRRQKDEFKALFSNCCFRCRKIHSHDIFDRQEHRQLRPCVVIVHLSRQFYFVWRKATQMTSEIWCMPLCIFF